METEDYIYFKVNCLDDACETILDGGANSKCNGSNVVDDHSGTKQVNDLSKRIDLISTTRLRSKRSNENLLLVPNEAFSPQAKRKFKCELCKRNLSSKENLRKHILAKHIKLRPHICDICEKCFIFEKALSAHKQIHKDASRYVCICGKTYKVRSSYQDHIRRQHQAVASTPFLCHFCSKTFVDRQTLRMHLTSVHKPKTIVCSFPSCNQVFSTISLMHSHYRYHSEEKYLCSECGLSFRSDSYLQKHKRLHDGIRPYKCSECNKTYLSVSHLNQHWKRAHSLTTNFQCTFCGKCFRDKQQMVYHENAHKGEKPFACDFCSYRTSYRNTLYSHRKAHLKQKFIKEANLHIEDNSKFSTGDLSPADKNKASLTPINTFNHSVNITNPKYVKHTVNTSPVNNCNSTEESRNITNPKYVKHTVNTSPVNNCNSTEESRTENKLPKTKIKYKRLANVIGNKKHSERKSSLWEIDGPNFRENVFEKFLPLSLNWETYTDEAGHWSTADSVHQSSPINCSSLNELSLLKISKRVDSKITLNCTAVDNPIEESELGFCSLYR